MKFDHLRFLYYSQIADVNFRKEEEVMAIRYQRDIAKEGFPD